MNEKSKVKEFLKANQSKILVGLGIVTAVGVTVLCEKAYMKGVARGASVGFDVTIDWFDKNFEDLDLRTLWNEWAAANPDKVVRV